jgi:hypothetical protein
MQKPGSPHTNVIPAGTVVTSTTTFGANGTSTPINTGGYGNFVASLNVSAHSGTSPTLSVQFQDSADGGTTWNNVGSPISVTTTNGTSVLRQAGPFGTKLQAVVTVGGTTPSYTCSLDIDGNPN